MDKSYIMEPDVRELLVGCIFKYGPVDYVTNALSDETLGFSSLKSFNDIYESEYRIVHYFHSDEDRKKLLDGTSPTFSRLESKIHEYLSSIKVTCFSYSASNNLMWSHYANNHEGVCYCMDFSNKTVLPLDAEDMSWGNVEYSSHVPELSVFQDKTTEGTLRALLGSVVLTKSLEWSHEQEIRFFRKQQQEFHKYKPAALRAVIVGRRVSDAGIEEISRGIDTFNARNGADVRLLFAHRVPSTYTVGVHSNKQIREGNEGSLSARVPVLSDIDSAPITSVPDENG